MTDVTRRRFVAVMGLATVAFSAAPLLEKLMPAKKPEPNSAGKSDAPYTVSFQANRHFEPGDVITITYSDRSMNGMYRMAKNGIFERI